MADLQRSIPSMVDGLKDQRKILFSSSFKKNFITEKKVVQLAGSVSELSAYHHGEASLGSTIIGMAQDFVGSSNINLLQLNGQFGTRNQGGKDHASSRYIYTRLSPITRFLFPKDDDGLLAYLNEDGQSIEPTWYMPTIPTVLVNGSEEIGTGWSSYVPNYNPRDIIANIRRLMNGEPMEPIDPWYRGFKGAIEKTATKENGVSYTAAGVLEEIDETTIRVTELPIRKWTQDYEEFLESMMAANDPLKFFPQTAVNSFLDNKSNTIPMLGGEMEKPTFLSIESEREEEEMLDAKTETKKNGWFLSMFSRLQTVAFLGFSKSTIFDKTAGGSCNFNVYISVAPAMLSYTVLKKLTAKPTQVVMKFASSNFWFALLC